MNEWIVPARRDETRWTTVAWLTIWICLFKKQNEMRMVRTAMWPQRQQCFNFFQSPLDSYKIANKSRHFCSFIVIRLIENQNEIMHRVGAWREKKSSSTFPLRHLRSRKIMLFCAFYCLGSPCCCFFINEINKSKIEIARVLFSCNWIRFLRHTMHVPPTVLNGRVAPIVAVLCKVKVKQFGFSSYF